AIAGVAHGFQFPGLGPLGPHDFSGGIANTGAARKLFGLGFEIAGMRRPSKDWSLAECEETVAAYFDCLRVRNQGKKINRVKVYRELLPKLQARSLKAIEYKFYNIDAVLQEEGLPRLGESAYTSYQELLRLVVLDFVAHENFETIRIPSVPLSLE